MSKRALILGAVAAWLMADAGSALAAPPSGVYRCILPGNLFLGDLEIRGNTYRGIGNEGSFAPFVMGSGNSINFTAGLRGLEGYQIADTFYHVDDGDGHPAIDIRYLFPRDPNWSNTLRCFKE